jgi:hypothetical protein
VSADAPHGIFLRLRHVPLIAIATLLVILNAYLLLVTDWTMLRGGEGADWSIFLEAARRIRNGGELYAVEDNYAYRYSPLVAYAFAGVEVIGPFAWRALHVVAVASLLARERLLAIATLLSWPFWFDVEAGNVMAFVFVAAAWALSGSSVGICAFLGLTILVPRPLMVPLAVWLLWHHPGARIPFAVALLAHAVAAFATGWGSEWVAALVDSSAETGSALNFGPSRLVGTLWIPVGIAVAALLTWRGRVGLASLAISPYWLPYYFMMPLLELRHRLPKLRRLLPMTLERTPRVQ